MCKQKRREQVKVCLWEEDLFIVLKFIQAHDFRSSMQYLWLSVIEVEVFYLQEPNENLSTFYEYLHKDSSTEYRIE